MKRGTRLWRQMTSLAPHIRTRITDILASFVYREDEVAICCPSYYSMLPMMIATVRLNVLLKNYGPHVIILPAVSSALNLTVSVKMLLQNVVLVV